MDSEIALLCYPRKLWLSVGANDDLFDINSAKSERDRLYNELKLCNIDDAWIDFEIHNGTHEFCENDIALANMIDYLQCKK